VGHTAFLVELRKSTRPFDPLPHQPRKTKKENANAALKDQKAAGRTGLVRAAGAEV
jgi:hypothetical protein